MKATNNSIAKSFKHSTVIHMLYLNRKLPPSSLAVEVLGVVDVVRDGQVEKTV
jgi:hypothetical protein